MVRLPDDVPLDVGTTLMLQGLTAHYLTHSAFRIELGSIALVHAGGGGVGQLLIQLAKLRGATVIATAGSAEKAAIATARGADHVVLYRQVDFREAVLQLTNGVWPRCSGAAPSATRRTQESRPRASHSSQR